MHHSEETDCSTTTKVALLRRVRMKKYFSRKKKPQSADTTRLLTEKNNFSLQEEYNLVGNGNDVQSATININNNNNEEKPLLISPRELAEFLGVEPDSSTCVDGVSSQAEVTSEWRRASVRLLRRSVNQRFPKPPADLDRGLHEHLKNVQNTVHSDLEKLLPLLGFIGLEECLIDCYHRKTFAHLDDLLQNISSTQSSLVLINWVLKSYLSPALQEDPDLQDTLTKFDLVLFAKWQVKAVDTLLKNVEKDVGDHLEKILENQKTQEGWDQDEAYVSLYVDTIKCIEAMPKEAQKISSALSLHVREVCFTELLVFLDRYTAEQTEALNKEAKEDAPRMWHFFKTLKTCQELKKHVLSKDSTLQRSLLEELVSKLDNLKSLALNLQLKIVADMAEIQLKRYFKNKRSRLCFLISTLKDTFPSGHCQDVQKDVLDEAYELIVRIYLKHLLRSSQRKLKKLWSPDVEEAVSEDACILHETMIELAPGVQKRNTVLLNVVEMLKCKDIDALKITVAAMQQSQTQSEDVDLLPKLLRWKGLTRFQVREVLDVIPGRQPVSCFSWWMCL